jgi:hypothetical protein
MAPPTLGRPTVAASLISPYVASDEISIGDAVELFSETGHPISKSTLERQCRLRGVTLVRHGRPNYASWTALLKVHAAWVDSKS